MREKRGGKREMKEGKKERKDYGREIKDESGSKYVMVMLRQYLTVILILLYHFNDIRHDKG